MGAFAAELARLGTGDKEVPDVPRATEETLAQLTKMLGPKHSAALELNETLAKGGTGTSGEDEAVANGGLAELVRLLGAVHEVAKVHEVRLEVATAKRPPEAVVQSKCKYKAGP